jgi:uncharacterized membrane protein (DUF373 family)
MTKLVDYVIILLGVILVAALLVGVYKIVEDIIPMIGAVSFDAGARNFVVDTLTIFVILELLIGFMQYHGANRISPVYILDAGLFFITRELMIELYSGSYTFTNLVGFGVVLGVLGYTRVMLTRSAQDEKVRSS